MRAARRITGWVSDTKQPAVARHVLRTTVRPQDDAFGWFDYVSEIKTVGVEFLRSRGHTVSTLKSFYLFQSFLRQAKAFYTSAAALEHRSSPLNYYYAFLNLAKAYVLVHQPQFTGRNSGHGLGLNLRKGGLSKQFLTSGKSGVFPSFYRELTGIQLKRNVNFKVATLLGYCSDISFEYMLIKYGERRNARGQIVIATNKNSKRYWNIVAIQNFDALEHYRKSLQAFNALLEEVTMEPSQARTVFGLMAERMAEHRFFESRLEYDELAGKIIPAKKMIDEWNNALKPMLSIAPYDEPFDFQIDFPLNISDQLPFREPLATYAVIYFLSSLVRYYPDFLESLLSSRDAWIIERFMESAPVTLLLYMRNLIHGINFAYTLR